MTAFVYQGLPQRVVFGAGTLANLPSEVSRLALTRVLVLSTPGHEALALNIAGRLDQACAAVFAGARQHTPTDVTDEVMALVRRERIDGIVAIGGGSTIGLGKAIALRTDVPQLVVPTTYAGSELTNILGETNGGTKTTVRDAKVLPEVVLYDVDLTVTLPAPLSVSSGLNAIAHAIEALYAKDGSPFVSLIAEEGMHTMAAALPQVLKEPADPDARADALYGAFLCGTVLGNTSMALHHKLCHVLGGAFNLPHAQTHAVVLPHVVAYNAGAAPDAMRRATRALGGATAADALFDLLAASGQTSLRSLGLAEADLDRAAELATKDAYWNPRPVTRDEIREILDRAWRGTRPASN